jgi:hypothetical protein
MATSSITKTFKIKDNDAMERYLEIMERRPSRCPGSRASQWMPNVRNCARRLLTEMNCIDARIFE